MEDTLRGDKKSSGRRSKKRLNPCFNGRYSQSARQVGRRNARHCLNPCFNGRYSQSQKLFGMNKDVKS